jgi:hypothetical protein
MTGTAMQIISWLSMQDETKEFECDFVKEKKSLNQNSFYRKVIGLIAKKLRKPPCYIHNLMLRRSEIYASANGFPLWILLPDDDETEKWVEYHELYHYKPTLQYEDKPKGRFRWYRILKGTHEMTKEEMSRLIDVALDEMEQCEIMLPQDEAMVKAYEEHKKGKTK